MKTYFTAKLIGKMSDEELAELMLLVIRKHRIEIQVIFERMANIIGDEELTRFIDSLRPD